jgi:hypothetical protein
VPPNKAGRPKDGKRKKGILEERKPKRSKAMKPQRIGIVNMTRGSSPGERLWG